MAIIYFPSKDLRVCCSSFSLAHINRQLRIIKRLFRSFKDDKNTLPETLLWKDHEAFLWSYETLLIAEKIKRRYGLRLEEDTLKIAFRASTVLFPPFLTDRVLLSHRATLYRIDPYTYKEFEEDFYKWGGQVTEEVVRVRKAQQLLDYGIVYSCDSPLEAEVK